MIGFLVTMRDGSSTSVEADDYVVDDAGDLLITGVGLPVLHLRAGDWLMIDALGMRLAQHWPPESLGYTIQTVAELLGIRFGHYVHELREIGRFEDWRMNDLDTLCRELLAAVGVDDDSTSQRAEVTAVRELVARDFGVTAR
jgi:hypothetical protein